MKNLFILVSLLLSSMTYATQIHSDKKVSILHSGDSRPCFFFQLEGVDQADPALANNPWFGVPFDKISANNIYAMLLAAKTADTPVTVYTTGGDVCAGHAEVLHVRI